MEYMYDVWCMCTENDDNDLTITLAKYIYEHPDHISHGEQEKAYRMFIARHYDELAKAYKARNRKVFNDAVAACIAEDLKALGEKE